MFIATRFCLPFLSNCCKCDIITVDDRLLRKRSKETAYLANKSQKLYQKISFFRIFKFIHTGHEEEIEECFDNRYYAPHDGDDNFRRIPNVYLNCAVVISMIRPLKSPAILTAVTDRGNHKNCKTLVFIISRVLSNGTVCFKLHFSFHGF